MTTKQWNIINLISWSKKFLNNNNISNARKEVEWMLCEILHCERKKNKFACYAKRFSAKEAFVKSLGTGLSMGLSFNEIEVKNNKKGLPYIKLHKKSLKIVKKILKKKFKIFL